MKPELLLKRAIYAPAVAELERHFIVHRPWTAANPQAYVRRSCGNVRAAVTTTSVGFSRGDFEALPRLEILANFGPYLTLIDLAAARERKWRSP
jgi:lactate dehydrogenase-like 2-hydroxyacid dehydrogenase